MRCIPLIPNPFSMCILNGLYQTGFSISQVTCMPPLRINVLNQITFIITAEEMVGSIRCSECIELVIGLGERSGPAIPAGFRKLTKTKGGFTSENALLKLLYAGILKASEKWTHPVQN